MQATFYPEALLQFYVDMGVDEVMGDEAVNRTAIPTKALENQTPPLVFPKDSPRIAEPSASIAGTVEMMGDAKKLAEGANTLEELRAALDGFEGLPLKRTATHTVFADGNPEARIMFVGEAPGTDEDRIGKPFVGVSGQLLDKMLGAIGLSRETNAYISNVINWRPPGNRSPSDAEVALSLPFIQRHIELVNPAVVIFVGGVSAKALLHTAQGITRLRGRWMDYESSGLQKPIPAMAIFHPAYLLRSPAQKSLVWADLLSIQKKLHDMKIL